MASGTHASYHVAIATPLSLTLRPEPMKPVDRLSHRFSVAPVSSQRQSLGLGEIVRPVSSCGRFSAYLHRPGNERGRKHLKQTLKGGQLETGSSCGRFSAYLHRR